MISKKDAYTNVRLNLSRQCLQNTGDRLIFHDLLVSLPYSFIQVRDTLTLLAVGTDQSKTKVALELGSLWLEMNDPNWLAIGRS